MARIRTIKPDFWEDDTVGSLCRDARLLFVATWNLADDEGLLRWTPAYIKASVFMYDDDLETEGVSLLMKSLVEVGLVFPYRGGKAQQQLGHVVNFKKHQKINRPQPAKFAAPSLANQDVLDMYVRRDHELCHLCARPVNWPPKPSPIDPYAANSAPDFTSLNPSLDYIIPRSAGGSDYPSNIRIAHVGCNKSRSDRPIEQFTAPDSVERHFSSVNTSVRNSLNDSVNGSVNDSRTPSLFDSLPERKGKEGKGREEEKNIPASPARRTKTPTPPDRFDEFWAVYPLKKSKAAAVKAWTNAIKKNADPDALIAAAKSYADDPTRNPQYTAHAATWLNGERWNDERTPDGNRIVNGYQPFRNPDISDYYGEL